MWGQPCFYVREKMGLGADLTVFTRTSSKWIVDLK